MRWSWWRWWRRRSAPQGVVTVQAHPQQNIHALRARWVSDLAAYFDPLRPETLLWSESRSEPETDPYRTERMEVYETNDTK